MASWEIGSAEWFVVISIFGFSILKAVTLLVKPLNLFDKSQTPSRGFGELFREPQSGSALQPRVAASATLGKVLIWCSTLKGLRPVPSHDQCFDATLGSGT